MRSRRWCLGRNEATLNRPWLVAYFRALRELDPDPNARLHLDYFPTFRRRDLLRPRPAEMLRVKRALEETGLRAVVVQTAVGHFGPGSFTDVPAPF